MSVLITFAATAAVSCRPRSRRSAPSRTRATAHYHSVDLTDADAVEKVLAQIRDMSGRVTYVLVGKLQASSSIPRPGTNT